MPRENKTADWYVHQPEERTSGLCFHQGPILSPSQAKFYVIGSSIDFMVELYGEFGCVRWATAVDLVMRYGPLRGMKPHSIKSVVISALWAIAQDLVMRYGL
jgi:hypothetical protein